jgi:hypothetical protein
MRDADNDNDTWTSLGFQAQLVLAKIAGSVGPLANAGPIDKLASDVEDDKRHSEKNANEARRYVLA